MNLVESQSIEDTAETSLPEISESLLIEDNEIQFDVRCQSGTYVKEMVHSDEGRTSPSVAEVIGAECSVLWLDVIEIHAE